MGIPEVARRSTKCSLNQLANCKHYSESIAVYPSQALVCCFPYVAGGVTDHNLRDPADLSVLGKVDTVLPFAFQLSAELFEFLEDEPDYSPLSEPVREAIGIKDWSSTGKHDISPAPS
jgi:hypothetical protein